MKKQAPKQIETLSDEQNPAFIFSSTSSELLSKAVKGQINLADLAKKELMNRGLDINGNWIGFSK
jgi:hypothetical protein